MQTVHQELNAWHKRQATLLYHFASLPYLEGLLSQIDQLIVLTDALLDQRSGLDAYGEALANWTQNNTSGHFSAFAYPALMAFRNGVAGDISSRANERYDKAGEGQCSRMLDEYAHPMTWATHAQEDVFKDRAEEVFRYASRISGMMRRPTTWNDFIFSLLWQENAHRFPRLPRFRVHTDVACESEQVPPRTGVFVPQGDPMAALQFGWTGGYGELGDTYSLNDFGTLALKQVGRAGLWSDSQGLHQLINERRHRNLPKVYERERENEKLAAGAVSRQGFEGRPCKWYFVEMLEGEYEDHDGSYAGRA